MCRVRNNHPFITPILLAAVLQLAGCGRDGEARPLTTKVVFGEVGLFPGQFSYPRGIDAFDDSIFIVDKSARVQRLDASTGRFLGGFRMPEWELGKPTGLTVGPSVFDPSIPVVYVADTHYHRVMAYPIPDNPDTDGRESGEPLFGFGEYGTDPGQFVYPTDVALLADKSGAITRIYVCEYGGNDRITAFRVENGQIVPEFTIGVYGDGPGSVGSADVPFERPQAIEVDHARQELIVLDDCNHRIARLTLDGKLITWIGDDPGEATFLNPQGMTLLDNGLVLVAEFLGNQVQMVDLQTGQSRGRFGVAGRNQGELASPWGVAVIGRDAYVLDSGNNRVQGFRIESARLSPPWDKTMAISRSGGRP